MPKSSTDMTGPSKAIGKRLPSTNEILEAADALSGIFDRPEALALRKRFLEAAEAKLDFLHWQKDDAGRIAYLVQLALCCPQLLRAKESEWVYRECEKLLLQRALDNKIDVLFWKALKVARKDMRTGRPGNKARDIFRYNFIHDLTHPPEQLRDLLMKFNKSKAIDQLAQVEGKPSGKISDVRPIWRSYARLSRPLQKFGDHTQQESIIPPSPKDKSLTSPEKDHDSTKRAVKPKPRRRVRKKSVPPG